MQKESLAAREELRKIKEEIGWKEERFTLLADKVDKKRMAGTASRRRQKRLQCIADRR